MLKSLLLVSRAIKNLKTNILNIVLVNNMQLRKLLEGINKSLLDSHIISNTGVNGQKHLSIDRRLSK